MTKDCEKVLERLEDEALPGWAERHLASCELCRSAREGYRALDASPPATALPEATARHIRDVALREHSKKPSVCSEGPIAGAVALVCGLVTAVMTRGDIQNPESPTLMALTALVLFTLTVGGAVAAVAPGRARWRWGCLAIAVLAGALLVFGGPDTAASRGFWGSGVPCLCAEVAMSVLPLGLALYGLTRFMFSPLRAVVGAASATSIGLLALVLHCPIGQASHLACFHLLPAWLLVGATLALRRQLPSRSFAP